MIEVYHRRSHQDQQSDSKQSPTDQIIEQQEDSVQLPLEMQPIIKAIKKYALQTSALGMGLGISEIENIIKMIKKLETSDQQILNILQFVEQRHNILKETFQRSYGM